MDLTQLHAAPIEGRAAMSFDPVVAIRMTPFHARLAGWRDLRGKVFAVLGFRSRNPTAREFVTAVCRWQLDHPPLAVDGMLGPATWATLEQAVRAFRGRVARGTRPDWLDSPSGKAARPIVPIAADENAGGPEDRTIRDLVRAWTFIAEPRLGDPCLPSPVTLLHAEESARTGALSLPTRFICGTLRVGQVWQGASGANRIIVALTRPGRNLGQGAISFVTDSGLAYAQHAAGWNADVMSGVYAGTSRAPNPIQTLLDSEVRALLAATAARGQSFSAAAGRGATEWCVQNRDNIAAWVVAVETVMGAVARLRVVAPALVDTLRRDALDLLFREWPEHAPGPNEIPRLVGMLLARPGKSNLRRQAVLLDRALASLETGIAAGTAAMTPDVAAQITKHSVEVRDLIGQLRRGLRRLL